MKITIEKELFQWEKDRTITIIQEDDEPKISYVQFYNKKNSYSPEVALVNNMALIPNFLMRDSYPIIVLACIGEKGNTKVVSRKEFRVLKRAKPENYQDEENIEIIYDGGEEK